MSTIPLMEGTKVFSAWYINNTCIQHPTLVPILADDFGEAYLGLEVSDTAAFLLERMYILPLPSSFLGSPEKRPLGPMDELRPGQVSDLQSDNLLKEMLKVRPLHGTRFQNRLLTSRKERV